jgi:hypothetical protein
LTDIVGYILVGGSTFLNEHGPIAVHGLALGLVQFQKNGILSPALETMDLMVCMFPAEAPPVLGNCLNRVLEMCAKTCGNKKVFFHGHRRVEKEKAGRGRREEEKRRRG